MIAFELHNQCHFPEKTTLLMGKKFSWVFFLFHRYLFCCQRRVIVHNYRYKNQEVYREAISNISTPETMWETVFKSCQEDVKTELKQVLRWI